MVLRVRMVDRVQLFRGTAILIRWTASRWIRESVCGIASQRSVMSTLESSMAESSFRFFDRSDDYSVVERRLPHWQQNGTLTFITFRADDSLPKHVIEEWKSEQRRLLREHGIDPLVAGWKQQLLKFPKEIQNEIRNCLSEKWHNDLDACHGKCILRQPMLAKIVAESLHKFDGNRYELTDFIIMPNHVHLLAAFAVAASILKQCESWKHFTARQINRTLGRTGRLWQQDGFDHLVRSESQFDWLRNYLAQNPVKAGLQSGEFLHYNRELGESDHSGA